MVSFARARTRSWLSRLWPVKAQSIHLKKDAVSDYRNLIKKQEEQNNCFLEASKNGGIWFS